MSISRRQFISTSSQLSLAATLGLLTRCGTTEEGTPPNIVLLYSDELPPSYLGCYGGEFPTPNLDALAADGIRFTHSYVAAPMCTPSRYALLTGQMPGRCVHPEFLEEFPPDQPYSIGWNTYIDSDAPTIARILSQNGYVTGIAGKWHIGKMPATVQLPEIPEEADLDDPFVNTQLQLHQRIISDQIKEDAGFDYAASVTWQNFDEIPVKKLKFHNFHWITKGAVDFLKQRSED
ncbi:sulfatase-like hydrolase/transferase, partial [candidate division KSB1 bacterium]|nr:sulfatase-like hydrolase/transferase [candidate division KSB1 bacterium]